eukprot:GDKI01038645.1.p1 GENE.GDKI01038645.1~~GDKI01038645.1.p1  ORF type:complete len:191 (+),score=26.15 GDKI01038645.1:148-720(+)
MYMGDQYYVNDDLSTRYNARAQQHKTEEWLVETCMHAHFMYILYHLLHFHRFACTAMGVIAVNSCNLVTPHCTEAGKLVFIAKQEIYCDFVSFFSHARLIDILPLYMHNAPALRNLFGCYACTVVFRRNVGLPATAVRSDSDSQSVVAGLCVGGGESWTQSLCCSTPGTHTCYSRDEVRAWSVCVCLCAM